MFIRNVRVEVLKWQNPRFRGKSEDDFLSARAVADKATAHMDITGEATKAAYEERWERAFRNKLVGQVLE